MVTNSAHKHIHTHTLNMFYNSTSARVLLGLSMTNACEQILRKNHHHPGSGTGEFKGSRMRLRFFCFFFFIFPPVRHNGCDTRLVLRPTLRLQPCSQELLYTVNQLTPGHGGSVYKAVWCQVCFSRNTM